MQDDQLAAYRKRDRELDRIADERISLSRRQADLEEDAMRLSSVSYEVNDCLLRLGTGADDTWRNTLLNSMQDISSIQGEVFAAIHDEAEAIEGQRRGLDRQEDACMRGYEAARREAAGNQERPYKD